MLIAKQSTTKNIIVKHVPVVSRALGSFGLRDLAAS
jgi:hypothetical protein